MMFYINLIMRILIALIGIVLGVLTCVPNMLMSGSGTIVAQSTSCLGVIASIAFIVGGIYGAIYNIWYALVPGFILQIMTLVIPQFFRTCHEKQLKANSGWHDNDMVNSSTYGEMKDYNNTKQEREQQHEQQV